MRCYAICTSRVYNLSVIIQEARARGYKATVHRNVVQIDIPKEDAVLFIFQDGCFVYWGHRRELDPVFIQTINQFAVNPLQKREIDFFLVRPGEVTSIESHERFNVDIITLESNHALIKLAISFALAQSVKLESFETAINGTVKRHRTLPDELAQRGKISLSRKRLSKHMGEIFVTRTLVNLNSELLYVPKYFWKNPALEAYYLQVAEFLDVESRVIMLNQKLDALKETLDILSSELQHRHSSHLEIIIILLITVEIVLMLFQSH